MLSYIQTNIFEDLDCPGLASTSQTHATPSTTDSSPRSQFIDYYKFGTINIQGGFNNKLNDILSFYTIHNYDILVLTETGLHHNNDLNLNKTKHSKHFIPSLENDSAKNITHIYADDKGNTKGSGVSFIISDNLQKHVIKSTTFHGRILTVDLCFKGNHYIKLIGCYFPANASDDKNLIISCYKELEKILLNASLNNYQCIILGDLNINLDKIKRSNHYPAWRREIKNILKNLNMTDVLKFFHDQPSYTHNSIRHEGPNIESRIDYIFMMTNLLQHTFYAYTHEVSRDLFTTDHKAVGCYFTQDYFRNINNSSRKSLEKSATFRPNHTSKIHYKYHLMTNDLWSLYRINNGIIFRQFLINQKIIDYTPEQQVETYWFNIKNIINQTKEKHIPFSTYKHHVKHDHPLRLRQNNNKILIIRNILRQFSNNKLQKIKEGQINWNEHWQRWNLYRHQIVSVDVHFHSKETVCIPKILTFNNVTETKKIIQGLLRVIIILQKYEEDNWKSDNINRFINQRNDNLVYNQKRMINSILDHKPEKINLDRLHYYDSNTNQHLFTNNPSIIAEQTNLHFQRLGKSLDEINEIKNYETIQDLPPYWRPCYKPIERPEFNHMTSLCDEFSKDEMINTISTLPNNKAAGISGITYEDIKHLHEDFKEYIRNFFNTILRFQIYPEDWSRALLFPIPKPKAWDCRIENTRPIVLLETFRKLFVKILTQRINILLTTHMHNLINENNRAGLIGHSTLQPLQIIQHIIESANKEKKELWIGLQDLSKAYNRVNLSLLKLALERLHFPPPIVALLISLFTNRKNNVILPSGLSTAFDVLQGIDQGEVISPILWIIYYDPMFTHLTSLPDILHTTSVTKINNIYQPDSDLKINYLSSVVGYLDDTSTPPKIGIY
ncbi:unnamed protein product [Rhizophagus irregularis]|uniref:Reverse transcriptase domain-containing protein n=1 Tax=Rhizophagus irregularis TaxID=588596 RepID=A0A915ZHG8_9GLOM|nr:unnamed protein product [Rhizophagus irregularis]